MSKVVLLAFAMLFSEMALAKSFNVENAERNEVRWEAVGNPGLLTIDGEGGAVTGTANFDKGKVWGEFEVELSDFKTGIKLRDKHMKEEYLHTKTWPKAKLKMFHSKFSKNFEWEGELTLHGVKRKVKGKGSVGKRGSGWRLDASMVIVLSDYAIDIPSYMGVTFAKDVTIKVRLVL